VNEPIKVCDGCGQTHNQWLIYPHPAGGWWHTDFCMPPPDWQGPPAADEEEA
jgi:hypothetical protein